MSFFQKYGIVKAKSLVKALGEAIVKFDPEGATEAAIKEIEGKFDKLNLAYSMSKQVFQKEQNESNSILALYNQRLAAAEYLQAKPDQAEALTQLLTFIENMLPDIERESQEAADAKQDMEQLGELVAQFAGKLVTARRTVETAQKEMQRANYQKERAESIAQAAATAAGLSSSSDSLSSALDHMNNLAKDAKAEADAANHKAHLLQPSKIEDSAEIKAAMDAVSGNTPSAELSIQDRINALKNKI